MERRDYEQIKAELRQAIGRMERVIRLIDADIENQQNQASGDLDETPIESPVVNSPKAEKAPKHLEVAQRIVDGVKPTKPSKQR